MYWRGTELKYALDCTVHGARCALDWGFAWARGVYKKNHNLK